MLEKVFHLITNCLVHLTTISSDEGRHLFPDMKGRMRTSTRRYLGSYSGQLYEHCHLLVKQNVAAIQLLVRLPSPRENINAASHSWGGAKHPRQPMYHEQYGLSSDYSSWYTFR